MQFISTGNECYCSTRNSFDDVLARNSSFVRLEKHTVYVEVFGVFAFTETWIVFLVDYALVKVWVSVCTMNLCHVMSIAAGFTIHI